MRVWILVVVVVLCGSSVSGQQFDTGFGGNWGPVPVVSSCPPQRYSCTTTIYPQSHYRSYDSGRSWHFSHRSFRVETECRPTLRHTPQPVPRGRYTTQPVPFGD